MIRFSILCLTPVLFLMGSCVPSKPLTSAVLPAEVNNIQKFETISKITLIEQGNEGDISQRISEQAKETFHDVLMAEKRIPISGEILTTDTALQSKLEMEIMFLCYTAAKTGSIEQLAITPILDSLLEVGGHRFGLITLVTGFTRTRGNYMGQQFASPFSTPFVAGSSAFAMIVDAREDNIAFFKKSYLQEEEPTVRSVNKTHVETLFELYFLPRYVARSY
jgi:hypothetical protein